MKRKLMKNLILIVTLAVLCFAAGVTASAETEGYYTYEIEDGEAVITSVDKNISGDIIIPDELGGYPVVAIDDWAITFCDELVSIVVPNTVTYLGSSSIAECLKLENVVLGDNIKFIGIYNFEGTPFIENPDNWFGDQDTDGLFCVGNYLIRKGYYNNDLFIDKNIKVIAEGILNSDLSSITVHEDNELYSSDEYGVLFNKEKTELVRYPGRNKRTSYDVPYGVLVIKERSFKGSDNLTTINIANTVSEIEVGAFSYCNNLANIVIPDSVTIFGRSSFVGTEYYNNSDNWENGVLYVGKHLIEANSLLTGSYVIKNNTASVLEGAFADCANLSSITIPDSVKYIGADAFSLCYKLEKIIVDSNNEFYSSDDQGVLFDKEKTKLIQYPNGKRDIEYSIPDTVKTIGTLAFSGLLDLERVTIPSGVETIEYGAFICSPSLLEIRMPSSVEKIDDLAFCYSMFIENIYIEGMDITFGEYTPLTIGNVRIAISREEFIELGKRYVSAEDEETRIQISDEINNCLIYIDQLDYPTIHCHKDSTTESYAKEKAIENPIEYTIPYVLTHFFEGDWTYNYDNMIRYRKCIHCDELETESLETTTDSDVEIIEPIDPDTDFVVDVITDYVVIEETISNNVAGDFEIVKAFDITMKNKDGVHVQPDGTVKVKLPLDWSKDGIYKVYRVNDDGTLTDMNAYREGSHMVFETDHFSVYVIVDESEKADEPITPDEPQEEAKKDLFSKIIDWFRSLIDLIISWFNK